MTVNQRVVGSSPTGGAIMDWRSFSTSIFFLDPCNSLIIRSKIDTSFEKGWLQLLPFSKMSFSEKMQLNIWFFVLQSTF